MNDQPSRRVLAALHDSAYRWALTCCGFDEDQAREVMQMVYVEVLSGRAVFGGRSSVKTWLFAVVRRTTLRLAARSRRPVPPAQVVEATDDDACANGVGRTETRALVREALTRLSPRQRQVVELVYYHELTLAEAAAVLGTRLGTARQHFHRAKRTLAQNLEPVREHLHGQ